MNKKRLLALILILGLGSTIIFAIKKSSADQESTITDTTEVATTTDSVVEATSTPQEAATSITSEEPKTPPTIKINGETYWKFESNGVTVAVPQSIKVNINSKVIFSTAYKSVSINGENFETSGDDNTVVVMPKQKAPVTSAPTIHLSTLRAPVGKVIHKMITTSPNPTNCWSIEIWIDSNGYMRGNFTHTGAAGVSDCGTETDIVGKNISGSLAEIVLSQNNKWAEWLRGEKATGESLQKFGLSGGYEDPTNGSDYFYSINEDTIDRSSLPTDFFMPQVPVDYELHNFVAFG